MKRLKPCWSWSGRPLLLSRVQVLERFPSDLKDRKTEGSGLAGPGLGRHQNVSTAEDQGNGLGLNVRWQPVERMDEEMYGKDQWERFSNERKMNEKASEMNKN